jgi:hypothetical protein
VITLAQPLNDPLQYALDISQYLVVPEAQNATIVLCEQTRPHCILASVLDVL